MLCRLLLRRPALWGPGVTWPSNEERSVRDPLFLRIVQGLAAVVAIVFGIATVFAGGRVLRGADPGYTVFRPLLFYNTVMGVAYLAAGISLWRSANAGRYAAGAIFLLNLFVLGAIALVYRSGGAVAVDSLRAMTLRTTVWLVLFAGAWWLVRWRPAA